MNYGVRLTLPEGGEKSWSYERIRVGAYYVSYTIPYSQGRTYNTNYGIGVESIREAYSYETIHYRGDIYSTYSSDNNKILRKEVNLNRKAKIEEIDTELDSAPAVLYEEYIRILDYRCPPPTPTPTPTPTPRPKLYLPNPPNKFKKMPDCCDLVKEIHTYLGIGKMKQRKLQIAKAFLVPKGQGVEMCADFYEIFENLLRMMANGLIINPISKPLGSDYQHPNATAWASEMYEMMAESMSDGNSGQIYQMHSAVQMVQIMKVVAELSSKVDFLTEATGITPIPMAGELPVLFTIHESHKGFEKKKPKEIDVTQPKSDNEVETILGKMFKPSKIPYVKYTYDPNSISIAAAISKL